MVGDEVRGEAGQIAARAFWKSSLKTSLCYDLDVNVPYSLFDIVLEGCRQNL